VNKQDWKIFAWNDVLVIRNGRNQRDVQDDEGAYPICGSGGIMGYANDYLCPENTVIIGRKGNINKPIFMRQKFWNVDTAFGLISFKDKLTPSFLYYFCCNYDFEKHNKTVTIPSLTKADLLKIQIPVPPLSTQKQIVNELDTLSDIITKKKKQLAELDTLAQATFYEMFGDPVNNERGFPFIPLGSVSRLKGGFAFKSTDYINNGIKLVQISNVNKNDLTWEVTNFLPSSYLNKYHEYCLHENDIVMAMTRPIIKSLDAIKIAIVAKKDLPCLLNQRVGKFEFDERNINSKFLVYFCMQDYFKEKIERYSSTSLQPNVSSKQVGSISILHPPLSLQNQFAERIEKIEQQKALVEQSIVDVQLLFDSTMDKYFH